jgi:hypothetical protein
MKKLLKINCLAILLLLVTPLDLFAEDFGYETDNIEPPPAAPIDDYAIPFAFVAILTVAFYFYKTNLKTESK